MENSSAHGTTERKRPYSYGIAGFDDFKRKLIETRQGADRLHLHYSRQRQHANCRYPTLGISSLDLDRRRALRGPSFVAFFFDKCMRGAARTRPSITDVDPFAPGTQESSHNHQAIPISTSRNGSCAASPTNAGERADRQRRTAESSHPQGRQRQPFVSPLRSVLLLRDEATFAAKVRGTDTAIDILRRFCRWIAARVVARPGLYSLIGVVALAGLSANRSWLNARGLHQVWHGLGFERPDGRAATNTQAGLDSAGMRRFAEPARHGSH